MNRDLKCIKHTDEEWRKLRRKMFRDCPINSIEEFIEKYKDLHSDPEEFYHQWASRYFGMEDKRTRWLIS